MLHALSAAELAAAYRRRECSPVDVARAVIARIERCEPRVHATWAFDPEGALAMARASEARFAQGKPLSPLDGVPVTLKENIATRGVPVPLGTAATELVPAPEDAPPAARLREAGCVFVAKTTMPDYGMLSSGLSSFHELARNPWDLAKNPGGSSAGAGAAAAAGYGPLHLGTDIGGSIRLPAAWCGVVGFKPSNGRVPIRPPYLGRVAGPMTRTVEDAAALMEVLSRPDWRDATSLPPQALPWHELQADPKRLVIGVLPDAGWGMAVEPATAAALQQAAHALEAAGARVVPVRPFLTAAMAEGIDRFWRLRSWLDLQALPAERRARVLPFIREWVAPAAQFTAAQAFDGYSQFAALRDAAVAACQPFDALLSPTAPCVAFDATWPMPSNDPAQAMAHIAFTLPFNASEQPACSVPWGHDAQGLPIGLQVAGRRHDDVGTLRVARLLEMLRPPLPPWPVL